MTEQEEIKMLNKLKAEIKHLNTIVERLDELLGKGINDYIMGIDGVEGLKDMWERSAVREFAEKIKAKSYVNDVTEQEKEIERLKAENKELTKVVSSKVYDLIDNTKEIADAREAWEKQAKIDVLNELKNRYGLYYLSAFGVKDRMLADVLNSIIEEYDE